MKKLPLRSYFASSPFGWEINLTSSIYNSYRYSYNGTHLKDNEISGNGNHFDFGGYGLDPRIGRRWNLDPVLHEWQSDYSVFANNPIVFADPSGLDHCDPINPSLDCDSESHTSSDSDEDNSGDDDKLTVSIGNFGNENHTDESINNLILNTRLEYKVVSFNSPKISNGNKFGVFVSDATRTQSVTITTWNQDYWQLTIEAKNFTLEGLIELGFKILNDLGLGIQYLGDCYAQSNLAGTQYYDSYLQNQVFYNLDGSEASRGEAILGTIQTGLAIAPFLKVGATTTELCIVSNPESVSFFEGTFYSPKVLWQMRKKAGEFHSFPELVRNYEKDGIIGPIVGRDGVTRIRLRIPGTYKKFDGYFDFIKEADGEINHRFFQKIKPK